MSSTKKDNRIGESFVSKESLGAYKFIIVEYNNSKDVWIEFQDEHKARVHTQYAHCKSGSIKNPYHPSVYGVGCLGLMSDGSKPKVRVNGESTREYTVWHSMIERCYSSTHPSYKDVEINPDYLCYAYFLEHLPFAIDLWENNNSYQLDKDFFHYLRTGDSQGKLYSEDYCCFIPSELNNKISKLNSKCPIVGVKYDEKGNILDVKKYSYISDADSDFGRGANSKISECCNGKRKLAYGYKWHFEVGCRLAQYVELGILTMEQWSKVVEARYEAQY